MFARKKVKLRADVLGTQEGGKVQASGMCGQEHMASGVHLSRCWGKVPEYTVKCISRLLAAGLAVDCIASWRAHLPTSECQ